MNTTCTRPEHSLYREVLHHRATARHRHGINSVELQPATSTSWVPILAAHLGRIAASTTDVGDLREALVSAIADQAAWVDAIDAWTADHLPADLPDEQDDSDEPDEQQQAARRSADQLAGYQSRRGARAAAHAANADLSRRRSDQNAAAGQVVAAGILAAQQAAQDRRDEAHARDRPADPRSLFDHDAPTAPTPTLAELREALTGPQPDTLTRRATEPPADLTPPPAGGIYCGPMRPDAADVEFADRYADALRAAAAGDDGPLLTLHRQARDETVAWVGPEHDRTASRWVRPAETPDNDEDQGDEHHDPEDPNRDPDDEDDDDEFRDELETCGEDCDCPKVPANNTTGEPA